MSRRPRLLLAAVGLVAFLLHVRILWNPFTFDDHYLIAQSPVVEDLGHLPRLFVEPWGAGAGSAADQVRNAAYWRPLAVSTWLADRAVFGLAPAGFHLSNVLWHVVVCVLVAAWLLRLLGAGWGALLGALWFVAWPVHTEAVALVTYRTEVMASAFVLLALVLHSRGDGLRTWLGIGVCYACGLLSKETAATLPGLLLLVEVTRGTFRVRRVFTHTLPLSLVLFGWLLVRQAILQTQAYPFFGDLESPLVFMSVMKILVLYVRLVLVPWPLTPFYDWTTLPPAWSLLDPEGLVGLFVALALVAVAVIVRRRWPLVTLGLGVFAVALLPFMHLVPFINGAAERFLYLPSVGVALLVGVGVRGLLGRIRLGWVLAGAAAVLTTLGGLTLLRLGHWSDDLTLQREVAASFPESYNAHLAVGRLALQRGYIKEATEALTRADAILPDLPQTTLTLAQALLAAGRLEEAARALRRTLGRRGPDPELQALLRRVVGVPR